MSTPGDGGAAPRGSAAATSPVDGQRRPGSAGELFTTFTLLALQGFGGVIVVAQRVLCDERRWLSRAEFVELLSVGQVLPGPNICNVALMLGDRLFGWRGAAAALGGLVSAPFGIVLALAAAHARWSSEPAVAGALRGMGAVSAGLIAGTALKLASSLRQSPLGVPACILLGAIAFGLVGVLRVPLAWALLAAGPVAFVIARRRLGGGAR